MPPSDADLVAELVRIGSGIEVFNAHDGGTAEPAFSGWDLVINHQHPAMKRAWSPSWLSSAQARRRSGP